MEDSDIRPGPRPDNLCGDVKNAPTEAALTYTPGPWTAQRGEGFHAHLWVITAEGMPADTPLARLQDFDDASEPDARLIAAAPELLERLQAIIDWADFALCRPDEFNSHGVRNLDGPVFDEARAALAKAEGRS